MQCRCPGKVLLRQGQMRTIEGEHRPSLYRGETFRNLPGRKDTRQWSRSGLPRSLSTLLQGLQREMHVEEMHDTGKQQNALNRHVP